MEPESFSEIPQLAREKNSHAAGSMLRIFVMVALFSIFAGGCFTLIFRWFLPRGPHVLRSLTSPEEFWKAYPPYADPAGKQRFNTILRQLQKAPHGLLNELGDKRFDLVEFRRAVAEKGSGIQISRMAVVRTKRALVCFFIYDTDSSQKISLTRETLVTMWNLFRERAVCREARDDLPATIVLAGMRHDRQDNMCFATGYREGLPMYVDLQMPSAALYSFLAE